MKADGQGELIYETSFVQAPATEKNFLAFANEKQTQTFKQLDNQGYERCVSGIWMTADTPILRLSTDGLSYYYVRFSKENLKEALLKHLKSGNGDNFQFEHNGSEVGGCATVETWIIDSPDTKSPIYGFSLEDLGHNPKDIPIGTIFKTVFINNSEVWSRIMSGELKGFSIGGTFGLDLIENVNQQFSKPEKMTYNVQKHLVKGDVINYKGKTYKFENERIMDENKAYTGKLQFENVGIYELIIMDGYIVDFYMIANLEVADEKDDYTPAFEFSKQINDLQKSFDEKFNKLQEMLNEKIAENSKISQELENIKMAKEQLEGDKAEIIKTVENQPIVKKAAPLSTPVNLSSTPNQKTFKIGGKEYKLEQ